MSRMPAALPFLLVFLINAARSLPETSVAHVEYPEMDFDSLLPELQSGRR
jgi:hypothetical protein